MRKWNTITSECIQVFQGHHAIVNKLLYAPEISMVFSSSGDTTICAWPVEGSELYKRYQGHNLIIMCMAFVPPANKKGLFRHGSYVNLTDSLDIEPGNSNGAEHFGESPLKRGASSFSSRGKLSPKNGHGSYLITGKEMGILVTGSADKTAMSWSVNTGKRLQTFLGHEGGISGLAIDSTQKILVTASIDKNLRSWMLYTGQPLRIFSGHEGAITCLKVLPEKTCLFL